MVVPCYNEVARWNSEYWRQILRIDDVSWLLVDDGSSDGTSELLASLRSPNVRLLHLDTNCGKGEAVRRGLLRQFEESCDWVGFLDADAAFPEAEVLRFLDLTKQIQASVQSVWSSRVRLRGRSIVRKPHRHYLGRAVATTVGARIPELPYDTQSGLKFFRGSASVRDLFARNFQTRWLFDIEIFTRFERAFGQSSGWLWEEPLMAWQDVADSKITLREVVRVQKELLALVTGVGRWI